MQIPTIRPTLLAAALLFPISASVNAATISVETWGADPSSNGQVDWSGGNATFTHAINFQGPEITYAASDGYGLTGSETMTFYATPGGGSGSTFSGTGGSGNLTTTTTRTHTTGGSGTTIIDNGAGEAITLGFHFGGSAPGSAATLTVDGLATNTEYELVLYQASSSTGPEAALSFVNAGTGSSGNDTLTDVNRGNTKVSINYTTGDNTSVTLTTTPEASGDTWHWYAFSNQVIPEPSAAALLGLGLLGLIGRRRK